MKTIGPRLLVVGLLLVSFALALTSAVGDSPTMDEQNHIARGAAYLGTGDPRLSIEHPPLVNVLSALPVHFLLHPKLPLDMWWEAAEWYHFAENFLWSVNTDPDRIVFLARVPIIGLGLLLVALAFRWGNACFGAWGGLLAAAFCGLDPNLLTHMRLSTTDLGSTFFVFLATYALWRTLRRPTWGRVVWAGLALGLALASKLSALAFVPILGVAAGLHGLSREPDWLRRCARNLGVWALTVPIGAVVLWASYSFRVGPLGESGGLVPAPPYWQGLKVIVGAATGGRAAYLLGQYSDQGWWYYFPVALAVKTPLATLLGVVLAGMVVLWRPRRSDLFLLVPPVAYFLVSLNSGLNIGYRHLLPILPFLAVHIGRLASRTRAAPFGALPTSVHRFTLIALTIWLAVSVLCASPHYLAYFNALGGGPDNGWRVLADSNAEWGQDLKRLHRWMAEEGVERIKLSWFGSAYPEAYGISYELLPGLPRGFALWENPPFDRNDPAPGVYVISVTNLLGVHFPDHDLYAWFRVRPPDDKVGYSLFVYEVTGDE